MLICVRSKISANQQDSRPIDKLRIGLRISCWLDGWCADLPPEVRLDWQSGFIFVVVTPSYTVSKHFTVSKSSWPTANSIAPELILFSELLSNISMQLFMLTYFPFLSYNT